ncbi:MAG: virulence RhuM family protein [Acidimicrobiia bacterium]|nr:virulence RhuM family protein [Acidimicrobiia bacterium]
MIAIGYRIGSKQGTKFRIWATNTLKEYMAKRYTINPKRIEYNYQVL